MKFYKPIDKEDLKICPAPTDWIYANGIGHLKPIEVSDTLLNDGQEAQECDATKAKSTGEPMAQNHASQEWKERFAMWYVKNHPTGLYEIIEWIETNK